MRVDSPKIQSEEDRMNVDDRFLGPSPEKTDKTLKVVKVERRDTLNDFIRLPDGRSIIRHLRGKAQTL